MKWYAPLVLAIGIVIGASAVILLPFLQPSYTNLLAAQSELKRQAKDLEASKRSIARLEQRLDESVADGQSMRQRIERSEPLAQSRSTESADEIIQRMVEDNQSGLLSHYREKLQALSYRLNLTPEQYAALEQYYELQADHQAQLNAARHLKDSSWLEQLRANRQQLGSVDNVLNPLLTEEQAEALKTYRQEELANVQEMHALHQTREFSALFSLDEDQKDEIYAVYYDNDFRPTIKSQSDPVKRNEEFFRQRIDHYRQKLESILTSEQLAVWTEQQEEKLQRQIEQMKANPERYR